MSSLDQNSFTQATPVDYRPARHRRGEGLEYKIYFALVFGASLPIAAVRTVVPSARRRTYGVPRQRRGVFGEARAMANIITPQIFSA